MRMNLFEIASREKYRFPYKGLISVEDLWDLTLPQLDGVYKALSKEVKTQGEDSLMAEAITDKKLSNMIEIVKYIFSVKQQEADARKTAAENKRKRERIAEVLAQKEDEALHNMSADELKKLMSDLG